LYSRVSSEFKINEAVLVTTFPLGNTIFATHSNVVPCKSGLMFEIDNTAMFGLGLIIAKS